ncbi:MAG: hypothetical protein M1839_008288 [Geoglossum umbratile]|nr:MAG: hypothetical protein M1839_008288 [Geoglossum umbratile]
MPAAEVPATVSANSSGDNGSNLQRSRYDSPPQHVSELGAINNPYERTGHQANVSANAASDQQGTKTPPVAFSPVRIGYPHHLPNGYTAPRTEYTSASTIRNPYIARADEIGLYHNIPGLGHLGLELVPPNPWKVGDEPVNPIEASYLFELSRQTARAEHERLDVDSMAGEEKVMSHRLWLRDLRKHEFIRDLRIDIWNKSTEGKQAPSQYQRGQYQSSFSPTPHTGYYQKSHSLHQTDTSVDSLRGRATDFKQSQSLGSSGDLPSPSGLDPFLIRQSVESAVDRFQYQQTQVELTRLQSERQLGNVLNHFKDHIEQTPLVSHQGVISTLTQSTPTGQGGGAPEQLVLTTSAIGTSAGSGPCGSAISFTAPGIFNLNPSRGSYTLPLPQIIIDNSLSATEGRDISDRPPVHSLFNSNDVGAQHAIRDPLFGVPAYRQSIGHRDLLPPIRDALQQNFAPPWYPTTNRWAQHSGNGVGAIGALGTSGPSNAGSYQGESPHDGATSKPGRTANRTPRKRKEKKEPWYNQYIQNTEHPTHISTKEYIEATLANSQITRETKSRARRRKAPMKFDGEKGIPITKSIDNNLLESGVVRASYVNMKSSEDKGEPGLTNDTMTSARETVQRSPRDNGSATHALEAAGGRALAMPLGSGSVTYLHGNDQRLPKTALFSTALPQLVSPVRLVSTPVAGDPPPPAAALTCHIAQRTSPPHAHPENIRPMSSRPCDEESSSELSSPPAEPDSDGAGDDHTPAYKRKQDGNDTPKKRPRV